LSGKPTSAKLQRLKADPEYSDLLSRTSYFRKFENKILAGTETLFSFFEESLAGVYCHSLGTEVGTLSDKRFIPSEYLPFSLQFNKQAFTEIETEQKQALLYLAKNSIPYTAHSKGYAYLSFRGVPIGMGKLAGNRINNLFPNEWRLRIQPQESAFFTI
jgi:NOL1/NOP2/fmu family ribosome biogenesis protein